MTWFHILIEKKKKLRMGAPKHKWTPEEEEALMAGVLKHGPGKWRYILADSEYSSVLHSRSNVDLKVNLKKKRLDKANRNLHCFSG